MLKEHDIVVLARDDPSHGLQAGDIGTVVHVYPSGKAYEVEFVTFSGKTAALVSSELAIMRVGGQGAIADTIPGF